METLFLISLVLFSLSSTATSVSSSAPPFSTTVFNAAEALSNLGYQSMALTLQLASHTLNLSSPTATIFAPSDTAFIHSGQPPLLLLQFHIAPTRLSAESLKTLPFGSKIPTLAPNNSLFFTYSSSSPNDHLSINNVEIHERPIFDDGSVVVYGIDAFFNPSCQIFPQIAPTPSSASMEPTPSPSEDKFFDSASSLMRSRGYSIMATFLDGQLMGFKDQTRFTIFAPIDEEIEKYAKNITTYSLIFRQHVVPRLLPWETMVQLDKTTLQTFAEGYSINVTVSVDVCVLNGVPVNFPDMYRSDRMVVHGLDHLLVSRDLGPDAESERSTSSEPDDEEENGKSLHDYDGYH